MALQSVSLWWLGSLRLDRVSAVKLSDGHVQALRDLVNVKAEYRGEEEVEGSEWDGKSITTGLGDELAMAGQVAHPSVRSEE